MELQHWLLGRKYSVKFRQKTPFYVANALAFLSIETDLQLSAFFKCSLQELETIINEPAYLEYEIAKKRGGKRAICAPDSKLKAIQKKLNYYLQAYYLLIKPSTSQGFVIHPKNDDRVHNIIENAKFHTNKKQVLNIDLKDFFTSISAARVYKMFRSSVFNFNENIATALALLVTYQKKLPTGAPTSPVISNFICLELDKKLEAFALENNLTYSRYADDLTFSCSDENIGSDTILDIINIIHENGFRINEKKLRTQSRHSKQTVTGLIVNEKVNVDRKLLKKIRAMLHDITTNGWETATANHFKLASKSDALHFLEKFLNRLKGYIQFVGQVRGKNDPMFLKFDLGYKELFEYSHKYQVLLLKEKLG